jgi:hypothetical protein
VVRCLRHPRPDLGRRNGADDLADRRIHEIDDAVEQAHQFSLDGAGDARDELVCLRPAGHDALDDAAVDGAHHPADGLEHAAKGLAEILEQSCEEALLLGLGPGRHLLAG